MSHDITISLRAFPINDMEQVSILSRFKDHVNSGSPISRVIDFNKIIPMPAEFNELLKNEFVPNEQLDWASENWDSHWNTYDSALLYDKVHLDYPRQAMLWYMFSLTKQCHLPVKIMEKLASDFPMLTLIWIANGERESIQWAISQNGKLEVSDVIPFDTTPDWFMWYPKEYPALKRKL